MRYSDAKMSVFGLRHVIFSVLICLVAYCVNRKFYSCCTSILEVPDKHYDYVIVGAGTTGCLLAARLSRNQSNKVLLIEAGGHISGLVDVPLAPTFAQLTPDDWSFRTVRQKYSSFGMINQTHVLPRGKGLGGSGQINYLLHGLGLQSDFERWSKLGVRNWTYDDLKPYILKFFGSLEAEYTSDETCHKVGECSVHKKNQIPLLTKDQSDPLMTVFQRASKLLNKNEKSKFYKPTATLRDATRSSTYNLYLKTILNRSNLHVLTDTQAVMIRFKKNLASSLFILKGKRGLNSIFIKKELILSAGAIKTPQILMLSGIGPKKVIEKHKIMMVEDVEQVGANVHDSVHLPIFVSIKKPISITLSKLFTFGTLWDYFWKGQGYLSYPPIAGYEIWNNITATVLFALGSANDKLLRDLSNYKTTSYNETFPYHKDSSKEGFMLLASCLQPKSRGKISIKSALVTDQPVIDMNYLHHPYDVKCMIKAIRRASLLISSEPFREIGAKIHWPKLERCLPFWSGEDRINDHYLECIIREMAVTSHHIGGSCSMGRVVDEQFRLYGYPNVRIVDSSVLPAPITMYPNSVLIAMAGRAADFILNKDVKEN